MPVSGYRAMWVLVMFDLPVRSKAQRKRAQQFRIALLSAGFSMSQLSVYIRPCASEAIAERHIGDIQAILPPDGSIHIFRLTDKQFERAERFSGKKLEAGPRQPQQLEFF